MALPRRPRRSSWTTKGTAMATRTLHSELQCDALNVVKLLAFRVEQRLGRPAEATATVQLYADTDAEDVIGTIARIVFSSADGPEQIFQGVVETVNVVGSS